MSFHRGAEVALWVNQRGYVTTLDIMDRYGVCYSTAKRWITELERVMPLMPQPGWTTGHNYPQVFRLE